MASATKQGKKPSSGFRSNWTQFFPPNPEFTDKNVPDCKGKVIIVTGANSGLGKEVSRILYAKNAKVYVACRSQDLALKAIADIQKAHPKSSGELVFLHLDLADLASIKAAAQEFLSKETTLHLLFNNAGVMPGPADPIQRTKQGHEIALGVNCVGAFLLTKLLTPTLVATAKSAPANSVRVIWLSSFGIEMYAPEGRGVDLDNLDYHVPQDHVVRYGISKAGDWLLAVEMARRMKGDGIVSVALNPGNLGTNLARDQTIGLKIIAHCVKYPIVKGAFAELFAAFSPQVTTETDWTHLWIHPFGRLAPIRPDLTHATLPVSEGGNGNAQQFWEWNEEQVKEYLL